MANGLAKVPMQFFILLIGVMVFAFYQFVTPPVFFNPVEVEKIRTSPHAERFAELERLHGEAHAEKAAALRAYLAAEDPGRSSGPSAEAVDRADRKSQSVRAEAIELMQKNDPASDPNDTNYVFLTFILNHLPVGLIGLLLACVFAASMSSGSGELSALATTTVVDIYKRHIRPDASDGRVLAVSRLAMAGWGLYGIFFAQFANRLGSLVEAVNIVGSLFYGTMLGIFLLAFYVKRVGGTATFAAAFVGEASVLCCFAFTEISWLWYNVVGCAVVVVAALLVQSLVPAPKKGKA